MKYFLPDNSYKFGFRFKQKYPNVKPWTTLGLAGKPHLGDDLICKDVQGISTLEGIGKYVWGQGGGHQLHFYPTNKNVLIRFLHCKSKESIKTGKIYPGDKTHITGNSGNETSVPHQHVDIWDLSRGPININDITGFIDPSTYQWTLQEKAMLYGYKYKGDTVYTIVGQMLIPFATWNAFVDLGGTPGSVITLTDSQWQKFLVVENHGIF